MLAVEVQCMSGLAGETKSLRARRMELQKTSRTKASEVQAKRRTADM